MPLNCPPTVVKVVKCRLCVFYPNYNVLKSGKINFIESKYF